MFEGSERRAGVRVLVLGGTAFIGAAAVRALAAAGHAVTVFHRGRSHEAPLPEGVRHVHGERADLGAHRARLASLRPEVLLDMRCMTRSDADALLALARALGAGRVVAASSCDVYRAFGLVIGREEGPLEPLPLTEASALRARRYPYRGPSPRAADDPQRWQDDYDKLDVEEALLAASDVEATVVRLPMVYGPHDPRRRVHAYLRRMREDRSALLLPASLAAWRACRGEVGDAGRALALACVIPAAAGRIYHVGDPPLAEREWVAAIARAAGWSGRLLEAPDDEVPPPLRPDARCAQHLDLDTRRAGAELGWRRESDLEAALAEAVRWERTAPAPAADPEEPARDEAEAAWLAQRPS